MRLLAIRRLHLAETPNRLISLSSSNILTKGRKNHFYPTLDLFQWHRDPDQNHSSQL